MSPHRQQASALGSDPEDSVRFLRHVREAEGDHTYGSCLMAALVGMSTMEARSN